jgi:Leucine-rich repeat (LRR) protein
MVELTLNTKCDRKLFYDDDERTHSDLQIRHSSGQREHSDDKNNKGEDANVGDALETHLEILKADESDLNLVNEETFLKLFGYLTDVRELSLAHSQLAFVSRALFANFRHLHTLSLKDNAISFLPDGAFDDLTALTFLDLSGNKIFSVSQQTFSAELRGRLGVLDLDQNPLVCSCELV